MTTARFPDGSNKPLTTVRATYRLERHDAKNWRCDVFHARATTWREEPVLEITEHPQRVVALLEFAGDGAGYIGGAWPNGVATAFTARRDGDALVLELWDVEPTPPGERHLPGVDGP